MTARTIGYFACAAPLWILLAVKLVGLRNTHRDPMRRAVCAIIFCCAAILTASAPETIGAVNDFFGAPNVAFLINFSLVVVLATSVRVLIVYWQNPAIEATAIARRWILGYAVVVLGMAVLFWAGDAPVERHTDFETYYATTPYISQFVLLYLAAQAVALVSVMRACLRWARLAGEPWLRRGLRLIATASMFGLGVSGLRILAMAARWFGADWDMLNTRASVVCAMAGLTLGALGFALPAFPEYAVRFCDLMTSYRNYRALYPLWNALRTGMPDIVLPTYVPWWDTPLRTVRRLAEINDGRLALRSAMDQRVALRARALGREGGLSGSDLTAVIEAALLRGALTAGPHSSHQAPADAASEPVSIDASTHGLEELEWLARVSRAFAASPLVDEAVRTATYSPDSA